MRRGINIRKKKRIALNESNKKSIKILSLLILILIICMTIYFFFVQGIFIKKNFEDDSTDFSNLNKNIPFNINKIILFSSATAETDTVNQHLSLDISGYCDIGIYLNNLDKENTSIKSLSINNIKISSPELGTPYLYKKKINDLGKCSFSEDATIKDNFNFNIINSDAKINYDNYELSSDGTTPISLGFYNKNVKEEFITDSQEIVYNGTLFKNALIAQTSLNCNVSFSINITTTNNEEYMCNINFDIPFEDDTGSMYDTGYTTKEYTGTQTGNFIRIK